MANTTWSATDKTAAITLSGGNLTAGASSTGNNAVRAADRQLSGKYYFEATWTATNSGNDAIGVAGAGANLAASPAAAPQQCAALIHNGGVYVNGVSQGLSLPIWSAGSVACVAVDCGNRLIWFRVGAAGNWNGNAGYDPGAGTGGVSIASVLGGAVPAYPIAFVQISTSSVTANFGDTAFTGAVPSGFTSGFTAGASPPLSAIATQAALEQWGVGTPAAQLTQIALEQWGSVTTAALPTGQPMITMVM